MRPARALGAAFPLFLLAALIGACGGGDDGEEAIDDDSLAAGAAFGARLLTVGEPLGTIVDSRVQAVVPGLQLALNADAVATIAGAVEDGDERLDTIAETAGMTPEEFGAEWRSDRAAAFSAFAAGLAAAEEPRALRDELFLDELTALPVHPSGVLLGSGRIDRPDGEQGFFLIYDVALSTVETEATVGRQLDQSPWQVTGGQSSTDLGFFQFQSTINADIQGVVWVLPLPQGAIGTPVRASLDPSEDGDDGVADATGAAVADVQATVVYLVEVQPAMQPEEQPFALPDARPLRSEEHTF